MVADRDGLDAPGRVSFRRRCSESKCRNKSSNETRSSPYWAYAVDPPADTSDAQAQAANNTPRHVSGSAITFTPAQIGDFFNVPDWHPARHPAMPEVVAHGRTPDVLPAATVTCQTDKAVLRIPVWLAFMSVTSFSSYQILRSVCAKPRSRGTGGLPQ
jgi:hypothetical protein